MNDIIDRLLKTDTQTHHDIVKKCADMVDGLDRQTRNRPDVCDMMMAKVGPAIEAWVIRHLKGSTKNPALLKTDILWGDKKVEVKLRGGTRPDATPSNKARARNVSPNIFFEQYSNSNLSATWKDEPDLYVVVTEDGAMWFIDYPRLKAALIEKTIGRAWEPENANTEGFIVHYNELKNNGLLRIIEHDQHDQHDARQTSQTVQIGYPMSKSFREHTG